MTFLYCTVKGLEYAPITNMIGCQFHKLIGCVYMTFGGVPNSNVDDSLDDAYLGPFTISKLTLYKPAIKQLKV